MKNKTILLLSAMAILLCLTGFAGAQTNRLQSVNVQTLKSWMDKPEKITLIDGGSILGCLDARIPGAVCLPCDQKKNAFLFSSLPKESRIVVYSAVQPLDQDCGLINQAMSAGMKDVYLFENGLAFWRKAGNPVVSEKRIPRVALPGVNPKRLSDWQKKVKNHLIIDIRSTRAYAASHLDGAANFPLTRLHDQYADIPLDRTLLIVDDDGRAGFLAASYLTRKGFLNVQRLQGGMAAYKRGTR